MTRQNLIIFLAVLVTVIIIGLVVNFITRKRVNDLSPVTVTPSQVLPQKIAYPALVPNESTIVYFSDEDSDRTGLFRVNLATQEIELLRSLPKGSAVGWSPNRKQAIISLFYDEQAVRGTRFERGDAFSGVVTLWVYDVVNDRLEPLPLGTSSTTWDDAGNKIYYHYFDLRQVDPISELSERDAFGTGYQKLADIPAASSYTMQFLDENRLLLVPNLSDPDGATSLYLFDTTTKQMSPFAENKVFTAYGSPDGGHILYESVGKEHSWRLLESSSGRDTDLEIPVNQHYAAWVNEGQFLVVERQQDSSDRLWLIDVEELTRQELVLNSPTVLHVDRVFPTKSKTLYFTSNDTLYKLELP